MTRAERVAERIRSHSRQTVTLRRQNRALSAAVLAAAVVAGSTSVTVKASSGRLSGAVVAGAQFTIAGVTGTCTVTADAQALPTGLLTIAFTPAVPAGQSAAIGAAVTFTQAYAEVTYPALTRQVLTEDEKTIEGTTSVKVLPFEPGKPAPRPNDLIDGVPIAEGGVETIDADDGVAYYKCHLEGPGRPAA